MPERSTSPKHCSCSVAPTSDPSPGNMSTCPLSSRKPPKRSPSCREARRHHPALRGHHPHQWLAFSLNADAHEPPAQRHRPQPPRTRHVQVNTATRAESVILTVDNTGEKLTPQLVSTLPERFERG